MIVVEVQKFSFICLSRGFKLGRYAFFTGQNTSGWKPDESRHVVGRQGVEKCQKNRIMFFCLRMQEQWSNGNEETKAFIANYKHPIKGNEKMLNYIKSRRQTRKPKTRIKDHTEQKNLTLEIQGLKAVLESKNFMCFEDGDISPSSVHPVKIESNSILRPKKNTSWTQFITWA